MGIESFHAAHHTFCDMPFETHMHDCYELYLTLSENVYIETEQGAYNAGYGDVFVFPPFSFHKIIPSSEQYERCLLHFDEQSLLKAANCIKPMIDYLKQPANTHFKADSASTAELTAIFDKAVQCYASNGPFKDFHAVKLIGEFVTIISELPSTGNYEPLPQSRISRILKYVHDNSGNNLTVSEICKKFNIGSTTLHNMFCTNLGMPPGEYILRRKLIYAASLLKEGKSVTEAANISGFNSYSHFIRIFKSRMGMSPRKYTNNT